MQKIRGNRPERLGAARGRAAVAAATALAMALSGCAVGPDFIASAAPDVNGYTKDKLNGTSGAAVQGGASQRFVKDLDIPGQWWTLFHSKGLNRLIETALVNNHDLKAAEAALKVAKESVEAQKGFFYPTIVGSGLATRQLTPTGTIAPVLSNNASLFNLVTPQVSVSYTPDVWGLNRRNVESLQAQADMQRFQTEAAYLTLTSNIVLGAVQEASIRGQIEATKKAAKVMQDLLVIIKKEKALGQAAEADVAVQEAALAAALAAIPVLEKQLAQTRDLLTALTGGLPSEPVLETFELRALHLPEKLPVSLPANLIWQRPDVRAADENLHSASALVGVALANRLPNVDLTANAGSSATTIAQLFLPGNNFWTLGGQITGTIFDGGTLMHREAAAQAGYVEAAEQYKSTVVNAFQNVADSLRAIQHDSDGLKVAVAAEAAAAKSLKIVTAQYKLGQVAQAIVLVAEQTYLNAVVNRVQAQALRYSDTAALFQALGGGWWNRNEDLARVDSVAQAKIIDLDLYPKPKLVTGEDYVITPAK
ncbi:MAG: efflux transporter outer membrane subunit [Rhodoblastus sp.]|uniref:efflux transporter outer membrane subunit n=1 Tax=Rhodoblastus sp. TaxID=1962975 RepID=UPI003F9DC64C